MANARHAYAENAPGSFFVDETCIDCDQCRQIAPTVFREEWDHSVVAHQPESEVESHRAAMALVTCPTASIGTRTKVDTRAAAVSYPEPLDENVYFCGYASRDSFGASSYLITRPEGNVLIDSPRYARTLVQRIEDLGGVSRMFFSHRDDVADHEKFREHFGCRRIIHRADSRGIPTEEQWESDKPLKVDQDFLVIPVPGHTRGHVVILYRSKFLFTGDHLAWSERRGRLTAFRSVAWYSWPEQTQSMKRLLDYRFEWVLPGHGHRVHGSADDLHESLKACIEWMAGQ